MFAIVNQPIVVYGVIAALFVVAFLIGTWWLGGAHTPHG